MDTGSQLAIPYFTKEFAGREVEAKFTTTTFQPVVCLLSLLADIKEGHWPGYHRATQMGHLPVGLRYFDTEFILVGKREMTTVRQIAQIAKHPSRHAYLVALKSSETDLLVIRSTTIPLIRVECRDNTWLNKEKAYARFAGVEAPLFCGRFWREKAFTYVTSSRTFRNFSLSVDYCRFGLHCLSQLEIEYKGRTGLWCEDKLGVLAEFDRLGAILAARYGSMFQPSRRTKLDWLLSFSAAPEPLSLGHF